MRADKQRFIQLWQVNIADFRGALCREGNFSNSTRHLNVRIKDGPNIDGKNAAGVRDAVLVFYRSARVAGLSNTMSIDSNCLPILTLRTSAFLKACCNISAVHVSNMSTAASARNKFAELRALRASGKKRLDSYQVHQEEDLYEEVDEAGYNKVVRDRLNQDDFVIDDNGEGYADDGREDWGRRPGYDTESEDDLPMKGNSGKFGSPCLNVDIVHKAANESIQPNENARKTKLRRNLWIRALATTSPKEQLLPSRKRRYNFNHAPRKNFTEDSCSQSKLRQTMTSWLDYLVKLKRTFLDRPCHRDRTDSKRNEDSALYLPRSTR